MAKDMTTVLATFSLGICDGKKFTWFFVVTILLFS